MEAFLVNSEENYLKEIMFTIANIVLEDLVNAIRKQEERHYTYWKKKMTHLTLII